MNVLSRLLPATAPVALGLLIAGTAGFGAAAHASIAATPQPAVVAASASRTVTADASSVPSLGPSDPVFA